MPEIGFTFPATASLDFARRAEALGARSIWVPDRILYPYNDALVTLGAIAAVTTRVRIGTNVLLGVLRKPLLLAKAVATLDQLSNGRFILGLGVGSRKEDFDAAQVPIRQRGARMDELVDILKLAWSGSPIRFDGRFHQFDLAPMGARPIQQPHPPLWFGGGADPVLRRVARVGSGWIASTSTGVDGFGPRWATVRRYAEEAGRDPSEITPAALIHFSLDHDGERARAAMHDYLVQSLNPARAANLGPMAGTPDDLVRGAEAYFQAGVQLLILSSITASQEHLELLSDQVLPRLELQSAEPRPSGN